MDGQKKKKRCLYCGKKIDSRMKFCSAACMEKYEEAEKKTGRKSNILWPGFCWDL